jgi:hypothetical protein
VRIKTLLTTLTAPDPKPVVADFVAPSRQRRIKCDEARPACTQCVKSKKKCTGYPPPPRARIFEEVRIAPRPVPAAAGAGNVLAALAPAGSGRSLSRASPDLASEPGQGLTPPHTPLRAAAQLVNCPSLSVHRPSTFSLNPQDGQYFQLFRDNTASELSGFFDSSFWTQGVLQACHTEDAIRHSVVALGALYKTLEKMCESPPGSPSDSVDSVNSAVQHWEVAFNYYSFACKAVVNARSSDPAAQRTSLMATVLLACFDSFIGDHRQAIVQIQNGLRLLGQLRNERRRALLPRPEEPVEQDLIQMFTRLAIQAKSYDMAFHFPQPWVIRLNSQNDDSPASPQSDSASPVSPSQPRIPDVFHSLIEARLSWDSLCERMMRFLESMFQYSKSTNNILPTLLQQHGSGFKDQLEAWSRAYEPILASRNAPAKSSQEKTGIAVLKMNVIMGQILFMMAFSDSEQRFDEFRPAFNYIVQLAMEVVGDEERRAAAKRCPDPRFCSHQSMHPDMFGDYAARHIKPSFSADLGIVPPLFVVATKCRDSVIRRQAIDLLKTSSRREGMWDSELAARIGMWVATIEEEQDGPEDHRPSFSSSSGRQRMASPASSNMMASPRSSVSADFGDDTPLGPGGNARWDMRRESLSVSTPTASERRPVPAEKRVMIRAVEFDLRERVATIQCGTRGATPGAPDLKTRVTQFTW